MKKFADLDRAFGECCAFYANLQYVVVVPLVEYSMCCNVVVFERLYATVCVVWFKDL